MPHRPGKHSAVGLRGPSVVDLSRGRASLLGMKHMVPLLALMIAVPQGAVAAECPVSPDHIADIDGLIAQAQNAQDEREASGISGEMWRFWTDAPDAQAQSLLDRGMARREAWDLIGALDEFNALVEYCPDYAEGYNQRAFVNYLRQDYGAALVDLDRAIALSPNHVAALSGRALSLLGLRRLDEARTALKDALALNPWLSERALLASGGPLDPPGEDI
ncbi:TPR domain protein [Rhodobacteraceae bacterium KLH11]|nr:TPR domain protein [Rhodobacteraceae bacterium KLH11]